jgi:ubiquinone/menaquinone biosynthesis C-methylase UbiE
MDNAADSDSSPGPQGPRGLTDFDAAYTGTPPWDIGRPQPAFLTLANAGAFQGRVLDVGCGTGEHVLLAAERGLEATGLDFAPGAIESAKRKASDRGLNARFLIGDAFRLPDLNQQFDTVLDCGLFHIFEDQDRPRLVEGLRQVTRPGGRYFMLCFSDRQPGDGGPRRVSQEEIRSCFDIGWRVDSIEPVKLDINTDPAGALGWLASMTRI